MSFFVLLALLIAVAAYWTVTQILPERRQVSLLRQGLADGYLQYINEKRHSQGLVMLELDGDLMEVAERKASHQLMTGQSHEGWEYPRAFTSMFGKSLLMEMLLDGSSTSIPERLVRQRDLLDGEWLRCGIGVAGGESGGVVVALVLCRESWESAPQAVSSGSLARAFRPR